VVEPAGLLDRTDELGVLHGCAAEVAGTGRGHVVLAFGEAGIGKTALLRQFRDELPRRFTVLCGTCDPLSTPRPVGPLIGPASELGGELRPQKTVDHHVSAILHKLEVPTRGQASVAAGRLGLITKPGSGWSQ
jgi:predicted ATPase